jgi:hypothetical protein
MPSAECELRRIHLPRTRVNKRPNPWGTARSSVYFRGAQQRHERRRCDGGERRGGRECPDGSVGSVAGGAAPGLGGGRVREAHGGVAGRSETRPEAGGGGRYQARSRGARLAGVRRCPPSPSRAPRGEDRRLGPGVRAHAAWRRAGRAGGFSVAHPPEDARALRRSHPGRSATVVCGPAKSR